MFMRFLTVFLLIPLLALPVAAGETGSDRDDGDNGDSHYGTSLNRRTTNEIVRILNSGFDRCWREKKIYRWDCFRQTYREANKFLKGRTSYSEAQDAIQHVEAELAAVVSQYRDPTKPKRRRFTQSFVPIKPEAIPTARARTTQAMEQAQTILLRAPSHTQSHYVRIADAINSNKVLLRSALLMLPNQVIRLALIFAKSTGVPL
ncbi:hypothetical protein DL239_14500 [Sedimentitalea sp. CY04]|uniref:Uncharacterized protein n=1 Tax=Parasedimentitalea denitrificans TaxID=2211118 RepID=A0ABX0WBF1_9RHOB|nr:hypothetical protein [Sedimentitalea sp. CY04]NIZ62188.1 hypothetical protein [Sedimentitalea sp. CY04]